MKVNRCLTEGRRRFLERYAVIESGAECERWADVLSPIADGEAAAADLLAVRPHLRNCPACRARIREFQRVPRALGAVVPVGVLAVGDVPSSLHHAASRAVGRAYEAVMAGLPDRLVASAQRMHAGLEVATSGKLAAVAMSATALGGGVAVVDGSSAGARRNLASASHAHAAAAAHARGPTGHTPAVTSAPRVRVRPTADIVSPSPRARSATPSPSPASRTGRPRHGAEFGFEGGGAEPPAPKRSAATAGGDEFAGGGAAGHDATTPATAGSTGSPAA